MPLTEELLKRFPYWDALNEVFNSTRSSAWPMSISSIMHSNASEDDDLFYASVKQERGGPEDYDDEDSLMSPTKRRRRLSDSTIIHHPHTQRSSVDNTSDSASTTHSTQSLPSVPTTTAVHYSPKYNHHSHPHPYLPLPPQQITSRSSPPLPPTVIRPLPRVLPSPTSLHSIISPPLPPSVQSLPPPTQQHLQHFSPPPRSPPLQQPLATSATNNATTANNQRRDNILAESLLQVTREKEAGRMKRSQDMLQFLREKRQERDQLLIEKELTRRVKAKADLVKNLMEAGFDKAAIAEQLSML